MCRRSSGEKLRNVSRFSLSEKIFDISMAQVEAVVDPDGIGNDIGREAMALISIHRAILSISPG